MFPWMKYIEGISVGKSESNESFVGKGFTLAFTKQDYVNLHNFVRTMYNALLIMMVFKKQPNDISVLFLDAHPAGMLDKPWNTIFSQVHRVGTISRPVLYQNLIWDLKKAMED